MRPRLRGLSSANVLEIYLDKVLVLTLNRRRALQSVTVLPNVTYHYLAATADCVRRNAESG